MNLKVHPPSPTLELIIILVPVQDLIGFTCKWVEGNFGAGWLAKVRITQQQ